jgi:lycopene beta-cyclase
MKRYDFIFAGGGLAGLSLACQIASSPLRDSSMLIVDQDAKQRDDRTISFWSNRPGLFDPAISNTWEQQTFHTPGFTRTARLGSYRYASIRGIDFYRLARQMLAGCPNVAFKRGRITCLEDSPEGAEVIVDGQAFHAKWAFDSRFHPADLTPDPHRYHYLKMAFRGWEVEAGRDIFNPETATLMDLRTKQNGDVRFFYVLPASPRRALVEYTSFTSQPIHAEACQAALEGYLRTAFKLEIGKGCQASAREGGSLLITDQPFPRQIGRHVLAIGLRGGRLKPSTGYAFTRIQRDSEAILGSLLHSGHPFDLPDSPALYSQLDAIMLEVMARHSNQIPRIFTALFKNNSLERVSRFLNEDAPLEEIVQLMATLPPGLFLQIMARRSVSPLAFLRTLTSA